MVLSFTAVLGICCILLFAQKRNKGYGRAYSLCSRIVVRFLQTAPVLFGSYVAIAAAVTFTAFAFGKHFVLDYDLVAWFSCLILILYHRLTTDKTSALLFEVSF